MTPSMLHVSQRSTTSPLNSQFVTLHSTPIVHIHTLYSTCSWPSDCSSTRSLLWVSPRTDPQARAQPVALPKPPRH